MRRLILATAAALSLATGSVAAADVSPGPPQSPAHSFLAGKVVSVDASAGTVVADVRVVAPGRPPGPTTGSPGSTTPPTLQQVTITTDSSTIVRLNGASATVADLAAGDELIAAFAAPPGSPLDQIIAGSALGISAKAPTPVPSFLAGKIVSVDASAGTVTADVRIVPQAPQPLGPPPSADPPQRVTITTDASTKVRLDDHVATVAQLGPGDELTAGFSAPPGSSLQEILAGPALGIYARSPRAFYGFVGTVTAVDPGAGTLSVNVLRTTPAAGALLGSAGGAPLTFDVGPDTLVLALPGGISHGTDGLGGVSVGDVVAAGYLVRPVSSLADLLAQPLWVLVDVQLGPDSGSSHAVSRAETRAFRAAQGMVARRHSTRARGRHRGRGAHTRGK